MNISRGSAPSRGYSECKGPRVAGRGESTVGEEIGEVCVGVCVCVGRSHGTWPAITRAFF